MAKDKKIKEDELVNRILDKLDKVEDRLDSIDKTLVRQEVQLSEHIRRTELLEKAHESFKEEIKPIKKAHTVVTGVLKIIGGLAILAGLIVSVMKIAGAL